MAQPDNMNDPDAVALPQVDVRYMPRGPLGGGPGLDASGLAEFGAIASAAGLERGQVMALVSRIQSNAAKSTLETLPELLRLVKNANDARINRIIQAVRNLPEAPIQPQSVWATLSGRYQQQVVSYVSRNEVLILLGQALVENLQT
jgi:hypothetical protein